MKDNKVYTAVVEANRRAQREVAITLGRKLKSDQPQGASDDVRASNAASDQLKLISVQAAVTYMFRAPPDSFGWACCTVNDAAGTLDIQSDWGSWSHRWSPDPKSLGAPSLTAFIAQGSLDYLARKLQCEGRDGRQWSAKATARALCQLVAKRRLEYGRESSTRFSLSREAARRIWSEIVETAAEVGDVPDQFVEQVLQIEGFSDCITEEPWQYSVTEQTVEDRCLREIVLPALIQACRDRGAVVS